MDNLEIDRKIAKLLWDVEAISQNDIVCQFHNENTSCVFGGDCYFTNGSSMSAITKFLSVHDDVAMNISKLGKQWKVFILSDSNSFSIFDKELERAICRGIIRYIEEIE